jgi:hypothetical protein
MQNVLLQQQEQKCEFSFPHSPTSLPRIRLNNPSPCPQQCELIDIDAAAEGDSSSAAAAAILIIRNGAQTAPSSSHCTADALFHKQLQLQLETRALMRGRAVNKPARHNVCYGEMAQQPHYEAGAPARLCLKTVVCSSLNFSHTWTSAQAKA